MKNVFSSLCVVLLSIFASSNFAVLAFAQSSTDMWSAYAEKIGTFSPHVDNCTSTEVFISVGSAGLGFCIDKNERTAATWEAARADCADDGKRLPEIMEFKYACRNQPTGLTNMTNNNEWASNRTTVFSWSGREVIVAPVMGNASCAHGNWAAIADSTNYEDTAAYRCVR